MDRPPLKRRPPADLSNRAMRCAVVLAVLMVATGCGTGASTAGSSSWSSPTASSSVSGSSSPSTGDVGVIRLRWVVSTVVDGMESRLEYQVLTDLTRSRYTVTAATNWDGPGVGFTQVWDGKTLLTYDPDAQPKYTRDTTPDPTQVPQFVEQPGSASFRQGCPHARRLGPTTILRRPATRYQCAAIAYPDGSSMSAHQLVLDNATGLLLQAGMGDKLVDFTVHLPAKADTFSTEIPAGGSELGPLQDFRLYRVGGGKIASADYRGRPLLVVTGGAAGIRAMLTRLAPITGNGTKPQVIGLLIAIPPEGWKGSLLNPADERSLAAEVSKAAGSFPVPVGIDFKGAAGYQISQQTGDQPGGTRPTAVGLVRSDGTLVQVLTETATDAALRGFVVSAR
jgi:hypothetical protein